MFSIPEEDPDALRGPMLTAEMVSIAEDRLGYKIPDAYLSILYKINGGSMYGVRLHTDEVTFYGSKCLPFSGFLGIGGEWSLDTISEVPEDHPHYGIPLGISTLKDWGYPEIGFAFSRFGHSFYFMDFSRRGKNAEPDIIYLDWEYPHAIRTMHVASSFTEFVKKIHLHDSYVDEL